MDGAEGRGGGLGNIHTLNYGQLYSLTFSSMPICNILFKIPYFPLSPPLPCSFFQPTILPKIRKGPPMYHRLREGWTQAEEARQREKTLLRAL